MGILYIKKISFRIKACSGSFDSTKENLKYIHKRISTQLVFTI